VCRNGSARKLGWLCQGTLNMGFMFDVTHSEAFWRSRGIQLRVGHPPWPESPPMATVRVCQRPYRCCFGGRETKTADPVRICLQ
jgi:hypothetical protein